MPKNTESVTSQVYESVRQDYVAKKLKLEDFEKKMRSEDKEITTLSKKAKSIENEVDESRQKARNCVWFIL